MMTAPCLFGIGLDTAGLTDWVLRVLAVIGAAALGGFGAGLLLQVSARLLAAQKVPRPILQFVRVLGAITLGLVVAFLLFRSAGPGGWGGPGGSGGLFGSGSKDGGEPADQSPKDTPPPKDKSDTEGATLPIEVLGDKPDPERRFYRFQGDKQLRTLAQVSEYLSARQKEQPPLANVDIVLYINSPDRDKAIVKDLEELLRSKSLEPRIVEPQREAPP